MSPTPLRVLVVDDDFMVASVHERFVQRTEGFEVVGSARTGADALELAARLGPDIVLLDVHLPDLSGLEVLARLRAAGSEAGVLMVTAERGAETVRQALHGGATQYLVKPFEYDDLAGRLQHVAQALGALRGGQADQDTIDRLFGAVTPAAAGPPPLPKGLSAETGQLVRAALHAGEELSAAEAGERLGLSRVSARRYLEHFVATGDAVVRLQYGGAGRPERRYRASGAGR
ncbi:response regulator [Nocardioides aurantiacus]|uniref:Transcriptional regulatory protein n=1 Tax=Nocardioides aurantiacus TaxID=86796 RepID=A0A3N2CQK6_9ACTN|nr:response regulator [Nocardioides aurantiacus]ROR89678.1 response regulator of citrate/malate metabolism [Nocardioides aurantiacus]